MDSWVNAVKAYFEIRNKSWINLDISEVLGSVCPSTGTKWYKYARQLIHQKHRALELEGKRMLRAHSINKICEVTKISSHFIQCQVKETIYWVYQDKTRFMVESRILMHRQDWRYEDEKWMLVSDKESSEKNKYVLLPAAGTPENQGFMLEDWSAHGKPASRTMYERVKAIRYAELWWNEANRIYPVEHDNSANFVSQCLLAGKLPMFRSASRASGWWFQGRESFDHEPWSYSWVMPHLLYQFAVRQLGAARLDSAKDLKMGDLVFYDWEGSNKYQHAAIVTDFDEFGFPLVNAHSDSSYHRPYTYFDSRAWSTRTRYAFIHLADWFS